MTQPRFLVIEADGALQVLLSEALQAEAYAIYPLTEYGASANVAEDCQPALALVGGGMRLHDRAGWRAAEALHHAQPTLPLILLSTDDDAVREVNCATPSQLFVAPLPKPFRVDALLATIARYVPR